MPNDKKPKIYVLGYEPMKTHDSGHTFTANLSESETRSLLNHIGSGARNLLDVEDLLQRSSESYGPLEEAALNATWDAMEDAGDLPSNREHVTNDVLARYYRDNQRRVELYLNDEFDALSTYLHDNLDEIQRLSTGDNTEPKRDLTFRREFERAGKKALGKLFEDVEYIPVGEGEFDDVIAKIPEGSNMMFMDHVGKKMFGKDEREFTSAIADKKFDTCIGGTCYGEEAFGDVLRHASPNTNFILDNDTWEGFHLGESGFKSIVRDNDPKKYGGMALNYPFGGTVEGLEQFSGLFAQLQELLDKDKQSNNNVDPLTDIAPYRVNPFQGYLAQHGGPVNPPTGRSFGARRKYRTERYDGPTQQYGEGMLALEGDPRAIIKGVKNLAKKGSLTTIKETFDDFKKYVRNADVRKRAEGLGFNERKWNHIVRQVDNTPVYGVDEVKDGFRSMPNANGAYDLDTKVVQVRKGRSEPMTRSTTTHELTHKLDHAMVEATDPYSALHRTYSQGLRNKQGDYIGDTIMRQGLPDELKRQTQFSYFNNPTEIYARIGELRRIIDPKNPGRTLTMADINKVAKMANTGELSKHSPVMDVFMALVGNKKALRDLANFLPATGAGVIMANEAVDNKKQGGMINPQYDTINNVPSNMLNPLPGRFDFDQPTDPQGQAFVIPKTQPFTDPIFGNKLLDMDNKFQPAAFSDGGPLTIPGVHQAFLGGLFKGIGKGIGKIGKGIFEGVKGVGDFSLSSFGLPNIIDNSIVDKSKFLSGVTGTLGKIAPMALNFVPGGQPFAMGLSALQASGIGGGSGQYANGVNLGQQPGMYNPNIGGSGITTPQGSLFGRINQQPMMGGNMRGNMGGLMGQLMSQLGPGFLGGPDGSGGIGGFLGNTVPGFAGGRFQFAEGGLVQGSQMIPIQTEKVGKQTEMVMLPDGMIAPVNATKPHSKMDKDEVTDVLPQGSYITSADKSMKVSYKDADEILMGMKLTPYKEGVQGDVPEEITFASLWPGNSKRKMTPAELTKRIMQKYKIVDDKEAIGEDNDVFTNLTNRENMESRMPYMQVVAGLNEEARPGGAVGMFKHGGPLRIPGIQHMPDGGTMDTLLNILPSVLPSIMSVFGGGNSNPAGVSQGVQAGLLGTIPMYQAGINQNISAQSGALNQGIEDFSALGNQLIDNARQSMGIQQGANVAGTGFGLMNALGMETDLQKYDDSAARSRINNFRPRSASRASIEAASTPMFDQQALAELGPRGATVLAQAESDRVRNANQLATQRNQFLDQVEQSKIGQLNQLDQNTQMFNIGQGEKEMGLRQQQRSGVFGTLGQGVQRDADLQSGFLGQSGQIQSQILPILQQMSMQNAGLAGQANMLGAQNAFNAFSTLGGLQSQNATANALYPPQQPNALNAGLMSALQHFTNNAVTPPVPTGPQRSANQTAANTPCKMMNGIMVNPRTGLPC